jgi:uncharacterized membrane protein
MTRWLYLAIAATVLAWAASGYVYLFQYDQLPENIAVHWDMHGNADKYVPRNEAWVNFWLMPAVMTGFLLVTVALPWISPKHFEVERFRSTYGYVMALVVLLFGYMHGLLVWGSLHPEAMSIRFLVGGLLVFFALLGNVLGRVRRNFWVGIRTPWTLANENVWNLTHRLGGWLFVAYGVLGSVAVFLGAPLVWPFVALIAVALVPVVYSLVIYKRLEKQGRV